MQKAERRKKTKLFLQFCVCYFKEKKEGKERRKCKHGKLNTDNTFLNELINYTHIKILSIKKRKFRTGDEKKLENLNPTKMNDKKTQPKEIR